MLVCAIAFVSYVLIPAIVRLVRRHHWKNVIARFGKETGIDGICTGYQDGKLVIKTIRSPTTAAAATPAATSENKNLLINPRKTRFYMFRKNGNPAIIPWRTVFLIKNGTTVSLLLGRKGKGRACCIFHEEKNAISLAALAAQFSSPGEHNQGVPEPGSSPVVYFCIATGAFLEFGLFLESLQHSDMGIVSMSALVGIFGEALPYLPPGLLLTLAGQIASPRSVRTKKDRQRKTAGFLLKTAGIVLNIAVVFFVLRKIGFGLP